MKKVVTVFVLFLFFAFPSTADKKKIKLKTTEVKPLSQIGEVNLDAVEKIKGQWVLQDSRFILEFSNRFACRLDGLKYYHYKRLGTNPAYPHIYTIVKSKKTGKYFFARGYYHDNRLYGSTSMIDFKNDHFIVYSSNKPEEIYFKAYRVKKE